MNLEDGRDTMNYDAYWQRAMKSAYHPLSAIEQAALLPLQVQYDQQGTPDRFWALVPVLTDDGAAHMEPLTVERVEPYAHLYQTRHFSIEASTEPKEAS